jgi:hypothetical protein
MKEKPGALWNLAVSVVGVASIPWHLWSTVKLWVWFAVPLGLPVIGMAHVLGLRTLVGLFEPKEMPLKDTGWTERERDLGRLLIGWGLPAFALLIGWIARLLM